MAREVNPTIALFGCGYTLTRLLKTFPPSKVVFTTRTDESLASAHNFISRAYRGAVLDLKSKSSIFDFFENYPFVETIVEGIPPGSDKDGGDPLEGVNNLCAALRSQEQVKRLIYLSTTGVFGVNDGSEVDERTECAPTNPKSQARLDSEAAYSLAISDFIALRVAAIYGPGRGIGTSLKNGTYQITGDGSRWSNRIHVDDLVTIIHRAIKSSRLMPKAVCVADDTPTVVKEIVDYYCERFSLQAPAQISDENAALGGHHSQLNNQRVKNTMLKDEIKVELRYPSFREGAHTEFET